MLNKTIAIMTISAILSGISVSTYYRVKLERARAETATVQKQCAIDLKIISDTALAAERKTSENSQAAAKKIEALDAQLTKERQTHETDNRHYRAALTAGAERVRIAVANCSASRNNLPSATRAASLDNVAATYADLDTATAKRIFSVAADDQQEIDKLRTLQGYVCAIRPETAGCQ